MRQEWLRAGDATPACWGCFVIFDDHVEVLFGPTERIDGSMTPDAARKVWADLQRGWYRATEADLNRHQMSHRALRRMAYGTWPMGGNDL
jgi:hypothetical protein